MQSFPFFFHTYSHGRTHRASQTLCIELAQKLRSKHSEIAGVGRGGLIVAARICHLLDRPLAGAINVRSCSHHRDHARPKACLERSRKIEWWSLPDTGKLLLIDDILDTGATMRALAVQFPHRRLRFAFLLSKQERADVVYAKLMGPWWVEFPWERRPLEILEGNNSEPCP